MKKLFIIGLLLLFPIVLIAQNNISTNIIQNETNVQSETNTVVLDEVDELYKCVVAQYNIQQYKSARSIAKELCAKYPDSQQAQIANELFNIKQKRKKKKYNGKGLFWTGNISYFGFIGASIPMISYPWNPVISIITGSVGGVIGITISLKHSEMTLGRARTIEFFTGVTAINSFALCKALFGPGKNIFEWYFPTPSGYNSTSIFPNTIDETDFPGFSLVTTELLTLGTRFLAIKLTKNKDLSGDKFTMINHSFLWGGTLTYLVGIGIGGNSVYDNLLFSLGGDLAALGMYFLYDKLNWTSGRTWLVSLSGLLITWVGFGIGVSYNQRYNDNYSDPSGFYLAFCTTVGLATGVLITHFTFPKVKNNENVGMFISPKIDDTGNFGVQMDMYARF